MAPIEKSEFLDLSGGEHSDDSGSDRDDRNTTRDSRTAGFASGASRKRKRPDIPLEGESAGDSDQTADLEAKGPHDALETDQAPLATITKQSGRTLATSTDNASTKRKSKPGVIYISRIPPYLKPQTLRHMISIHGPVTNLFLTPEAPSAYHNRVHTHHGNKKRQYIDGWVEFKHKRHAKVCVDALNGRTTAEGLGVGAIGGRKGGKRRWYRDDVWSVKYLRGFSWDDLMQSARTEEREREERIRFGVMKEKKERKAFLEGVHRAKVEETRSKKRRRKEAKDSGTAHQAGKDSNGGGNEERTFQQSGVWKAASKAEKERDDTVQRVLGKIF